MEEFERNICYGVSSLRSGFLDFYLTINSGDSCHPMLPYLAQGANSSLEDGAVLGRLLGRVKDEESIPTAISLYETLRKRRGEAIAQETFRQVCHTTSKDLSYATKEDLSNS